MKLTDLSVSDFVLCKGQKEYRFPVPAGAIVDLAVRSDKNFRVYIVNASARICIGPSAKDDLFFDGRFRMVEGEAFVVEAGIAASVGVRCVEAARARKETPDPEPVAIPVMAELTMEQKIAQEVERRLNRDSDSGAAPHYLQMEEDDLDWDDHSPYMEQEDPPLPVDPPPAMPSPSTDDPAEPDNPEVARGVKPEVDKVTPAE